MTPLTAIIFTERRLSQKVHDSLRCCAMPRIMPKRKKKRTTTPDKVTHRLIDSGFAWLHEHHFAEAEEVFQRALTLAQGTDELDGEDIARIEHLMGCV
jgi:ubiquitin